MRESRLSDALDRAKTFWRGRARSEKHAAALFVVFALGYVVRYLAQIVIARHLGVDRYGCWRLGLAAATVGSVLASFGYPSLLVRELARQASGVAGKARLLKEALVLPISLFLAGSLGLAGWSLLVPGPPPRCVIALWGVTLGFALLRIGSGVWRGLGRFFVAMAPTQVARPILEATCVVAATALGVSLAVAGWTYAAAVGVLGGALAVVGVRRARAGIPNLAPPGRGSWLRAGASLVAVEVVNDLMTRVDLLALGVLATTSAIGRYSAGMQIATLVDGPYMIVRLAIGPSVSRAYGDGKLVPFFRKVTPYLGAIAILEAIVGTVAVVYSREIYGIFGKDFYGAHAWQVLALLTSQQVVALLIGPVGAVLSLTCLEKEAALLNGAGLAANVLLNIVLIPLYGAVGAALATVLATIGWRIVGWLLVRRRFGVRTDVFQWLAAKGETTR